ncbi:MAG: phosphoglycerate mutase [Myxococcales bacterium]|nr:phosphoglycerate mutase [Myxococcales bacterium]
MGEARKAWPTTLWLVRHGESAGNVALAAAELAESPTIDVAARDHDVPLSNVGEQQAQALGRWFASMPAAERPTAILASPYRRACATAEIIGTALALQARSAFAVDERLREKEMGALNRLTKFGITQRFPEEVERRGAIGKFYYRPPGGESWCDVLLRLRSVLDTLARDYCNERVLVVSHQVIVTCTRYLLERMDEHTILQTDRDQPVPNCSVTAYDLPEVWRRDMPIEPKLIYFVAPLESEGAPVTTKSDAPRDTK